MRLLHARWRYLSPGLLAALAIVALASCHGPYPQSTLEPRGDFSTLVDGLFFKTVWLATIVFILVEGGLLWVVFKFRSRPNDADPKQIHGSTLIEIIWTIIPAVVLAIVAVPTVQTIFATSKIPATGSDGQPPLKVEVIGHQWFWEFRYPELGITTANELHLPVNRMVDLRMKSNDVIHSFWVPQFAGKRDIFPNRETRMWMTAKTTGEYPGACAEFCGEQHGRMDYYVMVDSPEGFKAWVDLRHGDSTMMYTGLPKPPPKPPAPATVAGTTPATAAGAQAKTPAKPAPQVKTPPPPPPTMAELAAADPMIEMGKKLVASKGCTGCHSLSSMNVMKQQMGPNLAGISTRKMIGAGWMPNTNENLHKWIKDPQLVKKGVLMPTLGLTDAEVDEIIAYLRTIR